MPCDGSKKSLVTGKHGKQLFSCGKFKYKAGNKKRLKNHYAKLLLSCDYFEKYTGFKTKLKNHQYKVHDKIKVYCNQCEYKTTFETILYISYLVINGKSDIYITNVNTGIDMRVKYHQSRTYIKFHFVLNVKI